MKIDRKRISYQKSVFKTLRQGELLRGAFFVVIFGLFFTQSATAQIEVPLSIKSSVQSPRPEQQITLTAESFSLNTETASISWSVNGSIYASGFGKSSILLTMGALGEEMSVSVTATGVDGSVARASRTFIPATVDLLWEALTYTPPLYKGKARFTSGASVRFVAIPNIVEGRYRYDPSELLFEWKNNGKTIGSQSGLGQDVFVLPGSLFGRDAQISVSVRTPTERVFAQDVVRLRPEDPQVLLYEKTPLSGVRFNRAYTNTFALKQEEVSFEVYPYFFSVLKRNDATLEYTWRVGGSTVNPEGPVGSITLRRGDDSGTVPLSLSLDNVRELLQRGSLALTISIDTNE